MRSNRCRLIRAPHTFCFVFYIMMQSYVIVGFPLHVNQPLADTKMPGDKSRENTQAYFWALKGLSGCQVFCWLPFICSYTWGAFWHFFLCCSYFKPSCFLCITVIHRSPGLPSLSVCECFSMDCGRIQSRSGSRPQFLLALTLSENARREEDFECLFALVCLRVCTDVCVRWEMLANLLYSWLRKQRGGVAVASRLTKLFIFKLPPHWLWGCWAAEILEKSMSNTVVMLMNKYCSHQFVAC